MVILFHGNSDVVGDANMHYVYSEMYLNLFDHEPIQILQTNVRNWNFFFNVYPDKVFKDVYSLKAYGMTIYVIFLSFFRLNFEDLNVDLCLFNLLLGITICLFFIKLFKKQNMKKSSNTVFIVLLFLSQLYLFYQHFFFKELFFVFCSVLIFYFIVKYNDNKLYFFCFIVTLLVQSWIRPKLASFLFALYIFLFLYYNYKKIIGFAFLFSFFMINKLVVLFQQNLSKLISINLGHNSSGGYCFKIIEDYYYQVDPDLNFIKFNSFRVVIKGILNAFYQPNPFNWYNTNYAIFNIYNITWYFSVVFAFIGMSLLLFKRGFSTFYQMILIYIISIALIIGIADGNIGTLVRHRIMIEPYLFVFSAIGVSSLIHIKKITQGKEMKKYESNN